MSRVIKLKEMEDESLILNISEMLKEGKTHTQIANALGLSKYKIGVLVPYTKRRYGEAAPTNGTDKRDDVQLPDDFYIKVYMDYEGIDTPRLSRAAIAEKYKLTPYKLAIAIDQGRFNFNALLRQPEFSKKYGSMVADASKGDFDDYSPDVLIEIQESIRNRTMTKQQAAEKMGWSRNKVDKLVALQIEYFKEGEIVSIAVKEHRLGDMMPASIVKLDSVPFIVVAQDVEAGLTTVIDMSRIAKISSEITLAHIQSLLLVGQEQQFNSNDKVKDATCAEEAIWQIKTALTAETLGEVITTDGQTVMVSSSSNFLNDFFITGVDGSQISPNDINFKATETNNTDLNNSVSEERYKKRHSADNKDLEPKSCEGYRVFSTASQIQVVKITTGELVTVTKGSNAFDDVYACLVQGDNESAFLMASGVRDLSEYQGEHFIFTVAEGFKLKGDKQLDSPDSLGRRIRFLLEQGDYASLEAMDKFVAKMLQNPSDDIIQRIPLFMAYGDVQICEDGDLYVYKAVNQHYRDDYTNKIDNSVGSLVFMLRDKIDPSTYATCVSGLHVCSLDYVNRMTGYSKADSKIMRVKLSPADIVAIPNDYGNRKIRCCRYVVVEDVTIAYHSGKLYADTKGSFALA